MKTIMIPPPFSCPSLGRAYRDAYYTYAPQATDISH